MRILVRLLTGMLYRIRRIDLRHIPDAGAAVIVCNHVSYIDALIIAGACRRAIRFVVHAPIYRLPVLNVIFRAAGAIPITSRRSDPETHEAAFRRISDHLRAGEIVGIFPEGMLTRDGAVNRFRPGIERILAQNPVPVVPMALRGLWGSLFSHAEKRPRDRPRYVRRSVELLCGAPVRPELATAANLEILVRGLRGERA